MLHANYHSKKTYFVHCLRKMLITGAYDATGHFYWDFFPDTENNGLVLLTIHYLHVNVDCGTCMN